jgi:putative endonuclease
MPDSAAVDSNGAWYVYIVRCSDASLYTGITTRIEARLAKHNTGTGARYTRGRGPVELVYLEAVEDRGTALRRDAQIKRLPADRKRRLLSQRR